MSPVAAVTRIAMIILVLWWNAIPVDIIDNAHPTQIEGTCDACTNIPRAHADAMRALYTR